jgi:hypothetical protein
MTACYLINRMPSTILGGMSPNSVLFPSSTTFHLPYWVFQCVWSSLHQVCLPQLFPNSRGIWCYLPILQCYFTSGDVTFVYSQSYYSGPSPPMECQFNFSTPFPTLSSLVSSPILDSSPSLLQQRLSTPLQLYTIHPRPPAPLLPPSSYLYADPPCTLALDSLLIPHQKDTCSCVTKHPISNFVSCNSLSSFSCFIFALSGVSILMHYLPWIDVRPCNWK